MCKTSYSLTLLFHYLHNQSTSDIGIFVLPTSIKLRNILVSMADSSWYNLCVYIQCLYMYIDLMLTQKKTDYQLYMAQDVKERLDQ